MDWTAFAPDFQALPCNVEYVEQEDEFDVVLSGDSKEDERKKDAQAEASSNLEREEVVDVVKVDRIPVFDSDSEDDDDVFYFRTTVKGLLNTRGKHLPSHVK